MMASQNTNGIKEIVRKSYLTLTIESSLNV